MMGLWRVIACGSLYNLLEEKLLPHLEIISSTKVNISNIFYLFMNKLV